MMIAIKDTDMPKNCKHCTRKPICRVYAVMLLNDPYSFNESERADDCPLVEIITCKDCNNWDGNGHGTGYCSIYKKYKASYDYCSDARGRE